MKMLYILLLLIIPASVYYFYAAHKVQRFERPNYQIVRDIVALFPANSADIRKRADSAMADAKRNLESIYSIKPECRTFKNTMYALDLLSENFSITSSALYVLSIVSPDDEVRHTAQKIMSELDNFSVDHFSSNSALFEACLQYEKCLENTAFAERECLTPVQKRFVEETMRDFRRLGLQLPADKRERVKELQKELNAVTLAFGQAISTANKTIKASRAELKGVTESVINGFKKEGDLYVIVVDGPALDEIMRTCEIQETRKRLYRAYFQRAYPENEARLATIIRLRDELAHMLGYPSYAHFEIEHSMAKKPEIVEEFLTSLVEKAQKKRNIEMDDLKKDLPEGISLTEEGLFNPWDLTYVRNIYKKKHFSVDESEVAKYFPLDHTLPALLSIYEKFFGLCFKKMEVTGLWHKDVEFLAVYKDGIYRGAVLLDLFPRPNKYTHAAAAPIVPSVVCPDGRIYPGVVLMMANFPQPQEGHPALLKRRDVITFFHEFGHVIHSLLGATQLSSFAGTNVKRDFVEMPSQMLESWMYDREILKMVSSHYKTKEPLSDELIEKIRNQKNYDAGDFMLGQLTLAFASLKYFMPGADKDVAEIWKDMHEKYRSNLAWDPDNKGYCGYGHLTNYGAGYYGYLWSQVFALDLFNYIEQYGLLNRTIGERYIAQIISKGGSDEPAGMIKAFLGREPNSDAFFKDLGL